jgi:hypothetical protein
MMIHPDSGGRHIAERAADAMKILARAYELCEVHARYDSEDGDIDRGMLIPDTVL